MSKKTVLVLVNKQTTVLNFRLEVMKALVDAGHRVVVSVPEGDRLHEMEAVGIEVVTTPMEKNSTNPIKDLALLKTYKRLIKEYKPDVVLTYTIKPNVYGGMAAASCNIPYAANITGLGTALENGGILQTISLMLYRRGFRKIAKVFFQNTDNRAFFEEHKLALGRHELLPGSGVNLDKFQPIDYPADNGVHFAFISRIRKEKGIEQYLDAARAMNASHPEAVFHVVGFGDAEYEEKMKRLHEEGLIVYHGLMTDVRVMLKDVHCVIHPSYYPEGMSNVLLESAASARPIISTDRAGCREAIDDNVNGYIIKQRDSADLIDRVEQFLALSYDERRQMGLAGRQKVEREFDRQIVVRRYLDTVEELTAKGESNE